MAYTGKFLVDNASLSPLTIFGVGVFNAYSGNGVYRNRGAVPQLPTMAHSRQAATGLSIGLQVASAHRLLPALKTVLMHSRADRLTIPNGSRCIGTTEKLTTRRGLMEYSVASSGYIRWVVTDSHSAALLCRVARIS